MLDEKFLIALLASILLASVCANVIWASRYFRMREILGGSHNSMNKPRRAKEAKWTTPWRQKSRVTSSWLSEKDEIEGKRVNRRSVRSRSRTLPSTAWLSWENRGNSPDVVRQLFSVILFVLTTASVLNRYALEEEITLEYLLRYTM